MSTKTGGVSDVGFAARLVVEVTHPEARPGAVVTPVPRALSADQQWQLLLVDVFAAVMTDPPKDAA